MATYVKPKNVRVSDICAYVNKYFSTDELSNEDLYKDLYYIAVALAKQRKLFYRWKSSVDMYDEFGLYVASELYMRLQKSGRLENVLNYVSASLQPLFLHFVKEFGYSKECFGQSDVVWECPVMDINVNAKSFYKVEFSSCLEDVCKSLRSVVSKSICASDNYLNVYVSCLLTLHNFIVGMRNRMKCENADISDVYSDFEVTLFRLNDDYADRVRLLVRKAINNIAVDLSALSGYEMYSDDVIKDLYFNDMGGEYINDKE